MRPVHFCFAFFSSVLLVSCVSSGKFKAMELQAQRSDSLYTQAIRTLRNCQDANNDLSKQKTGLQDQMKSLDVEMTATKENNTQLRKQLLNLSAISSSQAESIKKSFDNISAKDAYLQDLQAALKHRDSVNLAVVMNMKSVLGTQGVDIKIDKGQVYIDIADKLLFNSDSTGSSYTFADKAKAVLARVARVLNNQPDIEFTVEGHTDSVAFQQGEILDNWDLSVKRATAVVRMLQNDYNISPARMAAAGRSEYMAVAPEDTQEGREANRRTRIIVSPQMDQFFKVLERR
jgi:chemotaxis protein MotB